jgi:hypothetical protein
MLFPRAGIVQDDFVDQQAGLPAAFPEEKKENVIDQIARGELGIGRAIVALGVAAEVQIQRRPLVLP